MVEQTLCAMLSDEYRYKILKKLEADPRISQRDLARELGISVGKANYCLQSLIEKGLIKANNFKNSRHKKAYMYLLTSRGITEKSHATMRFLQRKMSEYEILQHEIADLQHEVTRL
ncbi:MAG: MarR family EPS-associated transcriptional regulator [Burkholderiales bacterium]